MSNVMKELKSEITRLARKVVGAELAPVKKVNAAQRGLIAALRRQVDALQKEVGELRKAAPAGDKAVVAKPEPDARFWVTGKGVKALRKRLGLTQSQFGKLAGVSNPTVVNWEGTQGKINLRRATAAKLQGIRGLGKKRAAEILGLETGRAAKAKVARKPKADAKSAAESPQT